MNEKHCETCTCGRQSTLQHVQCKCDFCLAAGEVHVKLLGPNWAPGLRDRELRDVVANLDGRSSPALQRVAREELLRRGCVL